MGQRYRADILCITSLIVLVAIVFFRLFYPQPLLIVTPDFDRSDAWHFSFATKVSLSRALSESSLPLWEPLLAGGFPLFAEGQVGALFLPNLILFRLLPVTYAYNSALALTFITLALGTYLYLRALKRSPLASLFAALTLTFSGLPVLQLTHITLLQGITLMPLMVWAGLLLSDRPTRGHAALMAVLLAQQIFAGFPQATFLTLLLVASQGIVISVRQKSFGSLVVLFFSLVLGVGLGALQLIPSYEFLTQIGGTNGFDYHTASYFSFPLTHLKTFLSPFALGNPRFGTYAPFYAFDGSVFWENTAYVGIAAPLLVLIFFFQKQRTLWKLFWGTTLGVSVLLALGKYAPTYILFSVWPFTLFRVPSRFLWITSLALVTCSAFGWDALMNWRLFREGRKYVAALVLFGLTLLPLFLSWHEYHLLVPAHTWTKPSTTTTALASMLPPSARVFTPDIGIRYTEGFQKGWTDPSLYETLRAVPMPDSNIVSSIATHMAYAGRFIWRNTISESLVLSHMEVGESQATISALGQKLLSLYGVTSVIMTAPLTHEGLRETGSVELAPNLKATVYDNPDAVSRFRLIQNATPAATVKEAARVMSDDAFIPNVSAVLASHDVADSAALSQIVKRGSTPSDNVGNVEIKHDTPTRITLIVRDNPRTSLLVTTDSYYPGWEAVVDGEKTTIIPANISQRAIVVPPGNHTIDMYFRPWSLRLGSAISLAALLVTIGLMANPGSALWFRIGKRVHPLFWSRQRNREG